MGSANLKIKGLLIQFAGFVILLASLWGFFVFRGTIYFYRGIAGGVALFALCLFTGGALVKKCKDAKLIRRNILVAIVAIVLVCVFAFWYFFLSDYSYFTLNDAIWNEHPNLARLMLGLGADIGQEKARDLDGITCSPPLLGAVMTDQDKIAEELLKRGARTDALYSEGFGLLEWCVQFNRLDTAKLLLRYGADPHQVTFYGTAMEIAQAQGKTRFVELFSAPRSSQ